MRRAIACGMSAGKVLIMMFWFFFSIRCDKVHPLEGGYFRLKHRRDRRPGFQRESIFSFYPRFAWGKRLGPISGWDIGYFAWTPCGAGSTAITSASPIPTLR